MNNITCNSNLEQSEGGLFVRVTPDEMYNHPDLFGGRAASLNSGGENASVVFREQEIVEIKPEILTDDMNSSNKRAAMRYWFIQELSQCNLLLRHQDTL